MTVTPVTVIAVAWVVRISAVAPVVIWSPPTPIRAADPTHLLDLCSRVCLDWCDWHRGCSGRCKATTKLLAAGVHPKIVQERLGHASITTTLDLYSHVTNTMQADAAARLDAAFQPAIKLIKGAK